MIQFVRYFSLLLFVILVTGFTKIAQLIIHLTENYLSADNELHVYTIFNINAALVLLLLLLVVTFLFTFSKISRPIVKLFYRFIDIDKLKAFFLKDDLNSGNKLSVVTLIASILTGLGIHFLLLYTGEPTKEGWLENITTFLFFIAAIFSLSAFFQIRKHSDFTGPNKRNAQIILVVFSAAQLFIFGEEISWGQHAFNWDSDGVFENENFQNETNLHNFFNPFFKYAYPIFGIVFFTGIFLLWFFPNKKSTGKSFYTQLFIPHPSLFYLVLLITGTSIIAVHETFEALLSFFVFFYSLRFYYSTRRKALLKQRNIPNYSRKEYSKSYY